MVTKFSHAPASGGHHCPTELGLGSVLTSSRERACHPRTSGTQTEKHSREQKTRASREPKFSVTGIEFTYAVFSHRRAARVDALCSSTSAVTTSALIVLHDRRVAPRRLFSPYER